MKETQLTDDSVKDYFVTATDLIDGIVDSSKKVEKYSQWAGISIGILAGLVAFGIMYYFTHLK